MRQRFFARVGYLGGLREATIFDVLATDCSYLVCTAEAGKPRLRLPVLGEG
jgi:hypothetical protein